MNPNEVEINRKSAEIERLARDVEFTTHQIESMQRLRQVKLDLMSRNIADIFRLWNMTEMECPRFYDYTNTKCILPASHTGKHHTVELDGQEHWWAT